MSKPKNLICSCCGAHHMGRQWHNRDTGYGLCNGCADWLESRNTPKEEMKRNYGEEGVHYRLPTAKPSDA